jgi:hypothetical protein
MLKFLYYTSICVVILTDIHAYRDNNIFKLKIIITTAKRVFDRVKKIIKFKSSKHYKIEVLNKCILNR